MKKTYEYTFTVQRRKAGTDGRNMDDWEAIPVRLVKTVTDRMEERDTWKAGYAANYFNRVMREQYGYKKSVVTAARIKEVK